MIFPLRPAALLLVCSTALFSAPALASEQGAPPKTTSAALSSARIPEVHTTSLTGQAVNLPEQLLHAQAAVLILGFSKGARTEARDWGRRLADDYVANPAVVYYEMPVLASVPRFLRPWLLRQIAAEVSDRGKGHFAPITDNEARWRTLAGVGDSDSAYVLLLSRAGDVLSTRSGPLTDSAYAALHREIEALPRAAGDTRSSTR